MILPSPPYLEARSPSGERDRATVADVRRAKRFGQKLKSVLPKALLGVYLNPDDIEQEIRQQGDIAADPADARAVRERGLRLIIADSGKAKLGMSNRLFAQKNYIDFQLLP